jgi:2,3-diketo-5-methylthio-1-phosphopentane phosphatase
MKSDPKVKCASPSIYMSNANRTDIPGQFIFFTDFDGTITLQDSNDFMTDNIGYGQEKRRAGNIACLNNEITFRDSFRDMMDSVTKPYDQCIQYLVDNIKLDPGFKAFFEWSLENNIPVVVLSSGMEPIIRALLEKLVGPSASKMQVLGNSVGPREGKSINDEGGWQILFKATTSPLSCASTRRSPRIFARPCFTLAMASQTCLLRERPISFSQRRAMTSLATARAKTCLSLFLGIGLIS